MNECTICYSDLSNGIICKRCKCVFHRHCIQRWFVESDSELCPYCKNKIVLVYGGILNRIRRMEIHNILINYLYISAFIQFNLCWTREFLNAMFDVFSHPYITKYVYIVLYRMIPYHYIFWELLSFLLIVIICPRRNIFYLLFYIIEISILHVMLLITFSQSSK